jgi:3',5'-cyclic AMP phosphodiesterase CpdA
LTRRLSPIALCALIALSISTAVALADPAGKTTLDETIVRDGSSAYAPLEAGPGEKTLVRKELAKPRGARTKARRTIAAFGTMTDPQVADTMSPARAELIDPAGSPFESGWRPQETFNLQNYDLLVRNMNANRTSPVKQGNGKRSKMGFLLNTGDMADSLQLNEARWYIDLLEGGPIDPFTGKPINPATNPCPQTEDKPEEEARLNADVAARNYTGIQDFDDWRGAPTDRYDDYWDPDEANPSASSPYAPFPRHPNLMKRALVPFTAQGLKVPWFTARGNHDALWQGTVLPIAAANVLTTACFKPFPNEDFHPERYSGRPDLLAEDLSNGDFIANQLAKARLVPPDPDRRFMLPGEYKQVHGSADNGHGFKFVNKAENKKSNGAAEYYAFTRSGIRFMAIDTNAEGGSPSGNVDDPQYKWVERELKAAQSKDLRVIAFSHHPLSSQTATVADEEAGACDNPDTAEKESPSPGCDLDPRSSKPIHRGLTGKKSMKSLFLKYPNVIAYVVGHIHENRVTPYKAKGGKSGFWEIATASEIDWPQQGRLLEVMNNRDGTLSIFGTVVNSAAPIASPAPGSDASVFTNTQLGSLSRRLAANDPQVGITGDVSQHAEGDRKDRNVELVLRDPLAR